MDKQPPKLERSNAKLSLIERKKLLAEEQLKKKQEISSVGSKKLDKFLIASGIEKPVWVQLNKEVEKEIPVLSDKDYKKAFETTLKKYKEYERQNKIKPSISHKAARTLGSTLLVKEAQKTIRKATQKKK